MARLEGTGKDPLGRYAKGIVFDVPESDPLYEELIDKGWANEVKPEDDPSRTPEQIAQAVVQQHPLTDPVDAKLADKMGVDKAYAVDHTGDPDAKPADVGLKLGKDVAETGTSTPEEVAERSAASQPKQGS